jgi:O-antigen/teichoic acid export membrane protein
MTLEAAATSGVRWTGLSAVLRLGATLVGMAVLARLLQPSDFGLMSLVMLVAGYASAYSEMGLSNALIQKQTDDPKTLSTLFWVSLLLATAVAIAVIATRTLIASFFHEPLLATLLLGIAPLFPLQAIGAQYSAYLRKEMDFKTVAIAAVVSRFVGLAAAMALAAAGFGVWALVHSALVTATVQAAWLFIAGQRHWRVRPYFELARVRSHLTFGGYQLGQMSIGYLAMHFDTLIIGRFIGTDALGAYDMAKRIARLPRTQINPVVTRVAFSAFAKKQDEPQAIVWALSRLQRMLSYVNLPMMLGLILVAPLLVPTLWGPGWDIAVPLMQILSVRALLQGATGPLPVVRTAMGKLRFNLFFTMASAVTTIGALWFAAQHGVIAIALARTIVGIVFGIVSIVATFRYLGTSPWQFPTSILRPTSAAAIMALVVWGCLLLTRGLAALPALGICVATGAIVFTATAFLIDRSFLVGQIRLFLNRNTKPETSGSA